MTKEYFDNCDKACQLSGYTAFLCKLCRKVMVKVNKRMKEMETEIVALKNRLLVLELEKETVAQRMEKVEMQAERVKEGLTEVEKEVVSGMEKAKEVVKTEVKNDLKEREERSGNIVIYGLPELKEKEEEKRNEEDKKSMEELLRKIEVETSGPFEVKFRAGKKNDENEKPRPLIVRFEKDEMRERIMNNARKLSKKEGWKKVFIAPDLTREQREEARKA